MEHSFIRAQRWSHEVYNYTQPTGSDALVTWNPPKNGGHLHAVLDGNGSRLQVVLDPSYVPVEGDMLTLTVTKRTIEYGNVLFLSQTWDHLNTPVTFMAKRSYLGSPIEWVLKEQRPDTLDLATSRAFSHLHVEALNCNNPNTVLLGARYSRQSYGKRLSGGNYIVNISCWGGSGIFASYLYMGVTNSTMLRIIGSATDDTGQVPYVVRTAWISGNNLYVAGDAFLSGMGRLYVYTRSSNTFQYQRNISLGFDKHACPPARSGGRVLMATKGGAVGIRYSADYGETWATVLATDESPKRLHVNTQYMYYGNATGLYRAPLGSSTWTLVLAGNCDAICAGLGTDASVSVLSNNAVRTSHDNGASWSAPAWSGFVGLYGLGAQLMGHYGPAADGAAEVKWSRDDLGRDFHGSLPVKLGVSGASLFDTYYYTNFETGEDGLYLVEGVSANEVFYQQEDMSNVTAHVKYFSWPFTQSIY